MEIEANFNTGGVVGATPPQRTVTASLPAPADGASFTSSTNLEAALKNLPDSRPEAVDRAQKLAISGNYPPVELIEKLADLLASKIGSQNK